MHGRHLTTFSSSDDVSQLSSGNVEGSDIVLMEWPVLEVLVSIFFFFDTSKESLLSCFNILDDTKSGSWENDLIVVFSKVADSLVSVSREPIDVVNLIRTVWLGVVPVDIVWGLFSDLLEECLISLPVSLNFLHLERYEVNRYLKYK